ncbi:Serine/threonine-protein kinase pim-2 [Anabarilius grahami]|uniref:non-specific serine/threonine protein kinase n=1 Tax=Anabarilius grahami TaxID=495550 RepID=A0A3N0Y316_ANAGA|nr:Serine/threonine-protein kinase pim-2 [Anabarilius grahami]
MESVEMKPSSPVSAEARLVLSNSTRTAGGNTTDPPGASPAAAVEIRTSEKQKKRKKKKKKGICAFLRRIGKALKSYILCCNGDDVVTPFPCSDPTDVQPDLSGLEWALSIDPCPSGIELPVNADPADPELSSLSDISSLELTSESDPDDPEPLSVSASSILELMSVSDISSLEMTPESDPDDPEPSSVSASSILELMSVSDISSLEMTPEGDPKPSSVSASSILELMSVSDISSLEMTPEGDPADLEPSSVTGPQILYSELTLDPEFVSVSSSLEIPRRYSIELTPDSSQADPEPSPVPGPSALDSEIPGPSGLGPAFEKQKKRKKKKKGFCAFLRRIGKAIKLNILCCNGDNIVTPFPCSNPELSSLSDISSLELTPESDPAYPEPSSLTGPSILYSELTLDPVLPFVSGSSSLEITPVSSLYSIELTPDSSQADPEPSPVPGPSALDSEIPGPSGLGPAFVFDLWFAENRTKKRKKKGMCTFFCRTWRAVKRAVFSIQRENKVAPDSFADEPVAQHDSEDLMPVLFSLDWLTLKTNWTDPEPFSVSDPSTLDSGITEAVGKQTKRSMKRDIRAFFQRAWSTIKSTLCCYEDPCGINPMDPADLQPRISGLSWVLTDPGPSYFERTSDLYPDDPELSLVPGPSSLEPVAYQDPSDSQSDSVSLDSQLMLDPGPFYLVSELTSVLRPSNPVPSSSSLELTPEMGLADPKPKSMPGSCSLKLTPGVDLADPEPKLTPGAYTLDVEPVPGPSGFWPATGSYSPFYEVKELLGSGGFATVCKGIRRFDNQMVAIKFLHKRSWDKFINLPGSTEPLLAEVAVNLLMRKPPKSPHIVQMLDWFEMPKQHIIIMEYPYPCESLLSFIMRNRGFLDETVARGLMRQAVLAAKHCIDRGVFHNDIKADNILVNTETLLLQLIDFGCSELFKTSIGRELAVQSTVWSLGRMLLDMVSGGQPISVLQKSRKLDPRVPHVSNECCDLIKHCLQYYESNKPTLEHILEHEWFEHD